MQDYIPQPSLRLPSSLYLFSNGKDSEDEEKAPPSAGADRGIRAVQDASDALPQP